MYRRSDGKDDIWMSICSRTAEIEQELDEQNWQRNMAFGASLRGYGSPMPNDFTYNMPQGYLRQHLR
jgi:hypothetical protein